MMVLAETLLLCLAFFLACFWGTGTDDKNLKSYASYPDEVQRCVTGIPEYRGRAAERKRAAAF